jgi:hypothetical protein
VKRKGIGRENKPGFVKQECVRKDQLSVPITSIKDRISNCVKNVLAIKVIFNTFI